MTPTKTHLTSAQQVLASIVSTKPANSSPLYVVEIGGGFMKFFRPAQRRIEWPTGSCIVSADTFRKILRDPAFRKLALEGGLHSVVGVSLFHASDDERGMIVRSILGI